MIREDITMLSWIAGIVGVILVVYLLLGLLFAGYEKSQTDDPFNWKIVALWPYMFLGGAR